MKILFGYVCPICRSVSDTEEQAMECLQKHVEYEYDSSYSMNSEYPINIRVWKTEGGIKTEWQDYSRDGDVHKVRR